MLSNLSRSLIIFLILIIQIGCGANSVEEQNGTGSGNSGVEFTTSCGLVLGDNVKTTVAPEDGEPVQVLSIVSPSTLIVQGFDAEGGRILVKLHGVSSTRAAKRNAAMNRLASIAGGTVYFYKVSNECITTVEGGGQAFVGQLINGRGQSLSEEVIKADLVDVEVNDSCGGEKIGGCLSSLKGTNTQVAGELTAFLWKPVSESTGNLAVHTGPYGADVIVNGEMGQNAGPGNGYGSLARFSRPGCNYASPQIQVYDGSSGLPYTVNGQTTFTVGNPCGRHCLVGGNIQSCSK